MSYARQMLDTCPRTFSVDAGVLAATIQTGGDSGRRGLGRRPPGTLRPAENNTGPKPWEQRAEAKREEPDCPLGEEAQSCI
jgi:hypothetical protein